MLGSLFSFVCICVTTTLFVINVFFIVLCWCYVGVTGPVMLVFLSLCYFGIYNLYLYWYF